MTLSSPLQPLVLTLTLDKSSQAFLTSLRRKYFPPHRNHLHAHLTFFHAIPSHRFEELDNELSRICKNRSVWDVEIGWPEKMGKRGVMILVRDGDRDRNRERSQFSANDSQMEGHTRHKPNQYQVHDHSHNHRPNRNRNHNDIGTQTYNDNHGRTHTHTRTKRQTTEIEKFHNQLLKFLKKGIKEEKDKLTNQDLMGLGKPHITVMNKEDDEKIVNGCLEEVRSLFDEMTIQSGKEGEGDAVRVGQAVGLEVWEYKGGPWQSLRQYHFQGYDDR